MPSSTTNPHTQNYIDLSTTSDFYSDLHVTEGSSTWIQFLSKFQGIELSVVSLTFIVSTASLSETAKILAVAGIILLGCIRGMSSWRQYVQTSPQSFESTNEFRDERGYQGSVRGSS